MRYTNNPLRPGLTAIAAVLALSSTPLFAQEAAAPPPMVTPPPVTVAPSAPVVQSAPVIAAPLITPPAPTVAAAPAPVNRTISPLPARETVAERAAPAQRATPRTVTAAAPAARAATPAPVEAAPVAAPAPVAEPAAPAPVAFEPAGPAPAAPAPADTSDDILPIAGAAGAAILLLGGGAYTMFGRRRREEEEVVYRTDEVTSSEPVPVAAAPFATPPLSPAAAPAFAFAQPGVTQPTESPEGAALRDVPVTTLPAGFDMSRYGRHVQAAYRGPTEDNRSLSLRRRLAHARFYDQRERMAAQGMAVPLSSTQPSAAQPVASRNAEYVTTKVKQQPRPGFRPAYSS